LETSQSQSRQCRSGWPWGRKFLGYSFWRARNDEIKRKVAAKAIVAYKTRIRQLTRRMRGRNLDQVAEDLRKFMPGWKEYFRLEQTPAVFRTLDEWVRHRLRALQLKQWRRPKTILRELRARGATDALAAPVAGNARCWWRNSRLNLNGLMPIAYFDRLGVPSLA